MINNSTDLLVVVDSQPEHPDATPDNHYGRKAIGRGLIQTETFFINNLTRDVIVVDRYGFRHKVRREPCHNGKFIVRTIYTIPEQAYNDCRILFAGYRGTKSKVLSIIEKRIEAETKHGPHGTYKELQIPIDHSLSLDDFTKKNTGNIYLSGVDLVISIYEFEQAQAHPKAMGSVLETDYTDSLGKGRAGFGMGVGIIMVNRQSGAMPMFTYAMKDVRTIPVNKSVDHNEGFYVTHLSRHLTKDQEEILVQTHYSLDKASEIGIYASREEALVNGDVKLLKEAELAELRRDVEISKLEGQQQKQKADATALELERAHDATMRMLTENGKKRDQQHETDLLTLKTSLAASEREHQAAVRTIDLNNREREKAHSDMTRENEREMIRMKDFYESKSYRRKDWSDYLKIISVTVVAMGGIYAAFTKAFPQQK